MASTRRPLQKPIVRLSVETAVLANATNLIVLIGHIIKKSKEVCLYKEECNKLVNSCIALSLSFTENQSTLEQVKSGQEYFECLQKVLHLVTQCTKRWSIRHIGWEIFIEGRLETLQKDLERCQQNFITEVLVSPNPQICYAIRRINCGMYFQINVKASASSTTQSLSDMSAQLHTIQSSIVNNDDTRQDFLSSVRSLGQELETSRREMRSMKPISLPHYEIITTEDKRLELLSLSTVPERAIFDRHKVRLEKIHADFGRSPRLIRVYKQIGDVSMVQTLFGVLEKPSGSRYALMEDLSEYDTLKYFFEKHSDVATPLIQKLQFAYDVASTLSSLHENRILVKNISETTIHVKISTNNTYEPVLSGLEEAREVSRLFHCSSSAKTLIDTLAL